MILCHDPETGICGNGSPSPENRRGGGGHKPDRRTGPADRTGGPADRTGRPADRRTGGPDRRTGPADRTGGPDRRTGPADRRTRGLADTKTLEKWGKGKKNKF